MGTELMGIFMMLTGDILAIVHVPFRGIIKIAFYGQAG